MIWFDVLYQTLFLPSVSWHTSFLMLLDNLITVSISFVLRLPLFCNCIASVVVHTRTLILWNYNYLAIAVRLWHTDSSVCHRACKVQADLLIWTSQLALWKKNYTKSAGNFKLPRFCKGKKVHYFLLTFSLILNVIVFKIPSTSIVTIFVAGLGSFDDK